MQPTSLAPNNAMKRQDTNTIAPIQMASQPVAVFAPPANQVTNVPRIPSVSDVPIRPPTDFY